MSEKTDFKLDFKVAKNNALYEWTLGLIDEVMQDKDKIRTKKQKYDIIQNIVSDAKVLEEQI